VVDVEVPAGAAAMKSSECDTSDESSAGADRMLSERQKKRLTPRHPLKPLVTLVPPA
jgi:hypothetical protein